MPVLIVFSNNLMLQIQKNRQCYPLIFITFAKIFEL